MPAKITAPITDRLSTSGLLKRTPSTHEMIRVLYRCRCQNTVELHIRAEAVLCVKCGIKMKPQV